MFTRRNLTSFEYEYLAGENNLMWLNDIKKNTVKE